MNIPQRLNHRRRIIYTALRSVLDKDKRIPKMFMIWDQRFGQASTFIASSYIETWMTAGLLQDHEKRDLSRALVQFMSYDYNDLKTYPSEFIRSDTPPIAPVRSEPKAELSNSESKPEDKPEIVKSKSLAEAVKLTQSGLVLPAGYVMFLETMQIILKHLKNTGRSNDDILQSLLGFIKERNLMTLEPLLTTWSKQGFSTEHLPKIKDSKVMQVFVVMFYKVASELKSRGAVKLQSTANELSHSFKRQANYYSSLEYLASILECCNSSRKSIWRIPLYIPTPE
jgi:hypothetical protein